MSAATDNLSTPTLDATCADLLQSISSHGGYACFRMATLAASGDFRAAEAAREMAWEQLHSGSWHSVLPVWRDAYSMACLYVAKLHYRNGEFREALRVLDTGLIMGGTLLRKDSDSVVEIVSVKSRVKDGQTKDLEKLECKLVPEMTSDKAEVLCTVPPKSLSCKTVAKRAALSLEGFLQGHFLSGSPVIMSDCMAHWPARMKWNDMDYLKRVARDHTVPVEINELQNDICVPDYCFAAGGELKSVHAWFGPAGTVTPLHHMIHITVYLLRSLAKSMSDFTLLLCQRNCTHTAQLCSAIPARVDRDNVDEREFLKVLDLEFLDCILEEGEMLYIPPKWWHYVQSLTRSFSVGFWWGDSESSALS